MSHLTDEARAAFRDAQPKITAGEDSLESIVAANPARRTVLKNGLLGLSMLPMLGALTACGDDDDSGSPTPTPTPTPAPAPSYAINFAPVAINGNDTVTVPAGYTVDVLLKAGDSVETGAAYASGSFPGSAAQTNFWAGGNHDGMEFFELSGVDPNSGGLLAINHELPDYNILFSSGAYNAATATADQKAIALSAVGVSVVEVAKGTDGKFAVKAGSRFNRRYSGNTDYRVGGPAAGLLSPTIRGTLNNCSSGRTPWGTYLTCEETTNNYLDPTQPNNNYGWVVEIDPYQELAAPTKRTAMGRFSHENTAYMDDANNRVAFYMGDDSTPGCIYKFVPDRAYSTGNRASNIDMLDYGTLYVARFNADGTGEWRALVQGQNGLVANASDPGNVSQSTTPPTPTTVSFNSTADVLINAQSAARVAGGTLMDRPEWITVAPNRQAIFVTLTNNSGRRVTDNPNPRTTNLHGHILKFRENGDSPLATRFTWEVFLLAGNPNLAEANLKGNISGDYFSSPDGLRIDPQGRLWVQTDHNLTGNAGTLNGAAVNMTQAFGNNSMYHVDQTSNASKRFLVGPVGCEITGIAYTPDLKSFFINIQHPTGNWPVSGQQPRSSTIVVRRTDGQPVGN
ncbi:MULTISPECIES: PhoX family protein [Sphingobium]|uniref:Tat pathway signal protein n=1 Tax=Sphingobium fuliginis (strain ATCC 27551) TaxID=336203 RepID=A0ABQ1F8C0_SPHSA|nr:MULTISPECIES: PhoX family phosphatase [Sphingobium]AJR24000.1 dTDP-glucose 4,6-dehydratase [Sphingobium sp. YBL2]RYL96432.1 PhoX family phosphatase [Sphingobium fuliginis]WDA36028.1 PhoX family phosphatase [Sphingobium sp. YC-XJ3]GGA02464.1 Tat pathway signal protein [Sphingobium fuliginis]